jgi:ABC-type antimicrobial peptide transport system permease subunit
LEIAGSSSPLTSIWSTSTNFEWNSKAPGTQPEFSTIAVTPEYGKTIGWQFVSGRDFSRQFASDSAGFVINETAAQLMGLNHPVNETVKHEEKNYRVLGVIKDMVMESPFKPASPTVFFLGGEMNSIVVKINPAVSVHTALRKTEAAFKKLFPTAPFDYKFVDEAYASKFAAEERISHLASFFAVLAIFISLLGLFGLASFVAEQRTKEIAVRKVLGASVFTIWQLVSSDFVRLVIISLLVAAPTAYYFMYNWLQNYEYRTGLPWWIFAAAGAGALAITMLTVSFQAIKAAVANPVKSLRTE